MKEIIYGVDNTENIVSIEYYPTTSGNNCVVFMEKDGIVTREFRKYPITCLNKNRDENFNDVLDGDQPFKYRYETYDYEDYKQKRKTKESFGIWRFDENIMSRFGLTYFKGMKSIKEVSALSFDLETTGLNGSADDAKILIISNTFDKCGVRIRKLFAIDDFESEKKMLEAWCNWVRQINPAIILGHNIYNFDIPYLLKRAHTLGTLINIGRDLSPLYLEGFQSQFRKDQITFISYRKPQCFGRQIIDTWLLAMDYDRVSQKYPNYKLKDIAKFEKIEAQSRVYYDASLIRKNWMIPEEMAKIKIYAENDADEALDLYYIVCSTKFLIAPHIPKGYQNVTLSATGSLCNSLMVRAYMQDNHSIAEASEKESYEGAVTYGNQGIYENVFKIDVSSLYPSIMLTYKVQDITKDPKELFLTMVKYFTEQRLVNKTKAKETGNKYYSNLEQVQKVFINSFYGFLGAAGLNYNYMHGASEVTRNGREIIIKTVKWAEDKNFIISNCDTDSISFCKQDMSSFSEIERRDLLNEINGLMDKGIVFADDGYFSKVIIFKAKNYIMFDDSHHDPKKKLKTKGSSFKAPTLEKALKTFLDECIDSILKKDDYKTHILNEYEKLVDEIISDSIDIKRWVFRKGLTNKSLDEGTKNTAALKLQAALEQDEDNEDGYNVMDRVFLYYAPDMSLKLEKHYNNDHNKVKLLEKLFKTGSRCDNILGKGFFPDYSKKRKYEELLNRKKP